MAIDPNIARGGVNVGADVPNILAMIDQRNQQQRQNALVDRTQQKQDRADEAKQTLAETQWALSQQDPHQAVTQLPHIIAALKNQGVDIATVQPDQLRAQLQGWQMKAASELGVGPPEETFGAAQTVTIPGQNGAAPRNALAQIGNRGNVRQVPGVEPYDPEKFGTPQDLVYGGKPAVAQVGSRGTVRPIPGAAPYNKPGAGDTFDPNSVENTAQLIYKGQLAPLSGFALKTPWGQAVTNRLAEIDKTQQAGGAEQFSGGTFAAKAKTLRDFSTGQQGNSVRFMNVAISHINTLQQLGKELDNGDTQAFNKLKNAWKSQTGQPAPTSFTAARDIVANEVVKAVTASGGALADRQEAQAQISTASSWDQLAGIADTWKQLLAGQLGGLKLQYETGTGMKNFDTKLYPETLKELGGLENPAPTNGPAVGTVDGGYRFKGGDPANPASWEKTQ